MNRKILAGLMIAIWVASGCTTTPPAEDPVLLKLEEIERRLAAVERVLANGSLVELTMRLTLGTAIYNQMISYL